MTFIYIMISIRNVLLFIYSILLSISWYNGYEHYVAAFINENTVYNVLNKIIKKIGSI